MTPLSQSETQKLGKKGLKLEEIYSPIADDLKKTEALFKEVLSSDNDFVLEMVQHLAQSFGKKIRSALVLLTYRACKEGPINTQAPGYQQSLVVAEAVELIHNATLVHDDIIDNSPLRRGVKTLNYRWGNEVSVLMGDFIFARVFGLLAKHVENGIIQVLSMATNRLCEGEIQEVRSRFLVTQTEKDYFDTIEKKTAALIAVSCEASSLVAGASEAQMNAMNRFGMKVGTAFQIADDLLDLVAPSEKIGKPQGHDVREGKITLPLIYALSKADPVKKSKIQEMLLGDVIEDGQLKELMQFIVENQGVEYARTKAETLVEEAKQELSALPTSQARNSLAALADYIIARDY